MPLIFLRVPELVIGEQEIENTIGNGFGDGYLCMNMAAKFYTGVSLLNMLVLVQQQAQGVEYLYRQTLILLQYFVQFFF